MKKLISLFLFALLSALAGGCQPKQPTSTALPPAPTLTPTTESRPTETPVTQGKTILVTSMDDSGSGTLRQAMETAQPYDVITFDTGVFPPDNPAAILVTSLLPELNKDYLTIDASNAGVILDGGGGDYGAFNINAKDITIQGLYIVNFEGTAITLWENSHYCTIGGNSKIGTGPLGQGNLITGNRDGIIIQKGGSYHTIAGNQIGVEFNDLVGNTYSGIQVLDHSPGNLIGPENVVAYSGAPSVEIKTEDAQGTTLTRNLIYGEPTVLLMIPQIEDQIPAPVILSFDPAGMVSGIACSGCVVEIFSGEDRWAEYYEGSVTAGPDGSFTFTADFPFSGTNVKATATTPSGATSNFSVYTPDQTWTLVMQEGNTFPASALYSLSSGAISEDNRISQFGWYPDCSEDAFFLDSIGGLGYKQLLPDFNEMEVPYWLENPEYPSAGNHDSCINDWKSRGIEITYIITFWDKQFQLDGGKLPCERFANVGSGDPETERFLQYVREVVVFMNDRDIHKYEIWNEPDNMACTQGIRPENYIKLIELLVPEIKNIDPTAKVYVASASGTNNDNAKRFLWSVASSDLIMPIVDGLSWHPFFGPSPALPEAADYYNNYPSFVEELKKVATESGFRGEYKADSMTWRTPLNADPSQPGIYEELVAAKYYARGIVMHLGMDIATGSDVGGNLQIIYNTVRNISTVMAGNTPGSLDVVIESESDNLMYYSFDMSNGDQLFAIWTNGVAVEYDPGVNATLTFPAASAQSVTGIDVLNGFEQELIAETENGNLVIRDLLVKDYPIIIRLTP